MSKNNVNEIIKQSTFQEQKQKLIKILNLYKNKILFPIEMINDIKKINGLEQLSHYLYAYNSFIKEARYLSKKLKNISFWGYFFNTYDNWFVSVNSIPIGIEKYHKEILKETIDKTTLISESLFIKLNSWHEKISIFMSIHKNCKNLDYIYKYINKTENIHVKKSLTIVDIKILLPVFSNSKLIKKINSIDNLYYNIPDLYLF